MWTLFLRGNGRAAYCCPPKFNIAIAETKRLIAESTARATATHDIFAGREHQILQALASRVCRERELLGDNRVARILPISRKMNLAFLLRLSRSCANSGLPGLLFAIGGLFGW